MHLPAVSLALGLVATQVSARLQVKRSPTLTVAITAPSVVDSVDEVTVTAAVTNHGAQDVHVMKYGSILDDSPTASFEVAQGSTKAPFRGPKVRLFSSCFDVR